jgi:AcrR family transcriptional regulator
LAPQLEQALIQCYQHASSGGAVLVGIGYEESGMAAKVEVVEPLYAGAPGSRRDLILREAARLFDEKGFNRTTARDIAMAADLLSGSIFYYFPSKAHILAAVIAEGMRYGVGLARNSIAQAPPDPIARFEALLRGHLQGLLGASRHTHNVANREWKHLPEDLRQPLKRDSEAYRDLWWQIMDELEQAGLLRVPKNTFYRFCIGGLNWTAHWHPGGSEAAVGELARQYRQLVLGR